MVDFHLLSRINYIRDQFSSILSSEAMPIHVEDLDGNGRLFVFKTTADGRLYVHDNHGITALVWDTCRVDVTTFETALHIERGILEFQPGLFEGL